MSSDSSEEEAIEGLLAFDDLPAQRGRRPHRPRRVPIYFFDVNVSEREFREKHRVSPAVLEHLVDWIGPELARQNHRGLPLSPRFFLNMYLCVGSFKFFLSFLMRKCVTD